MLNLNFAPYWRPPVFSFQGRQGWGSNIYPPRLGGVRSMSRVTVVGNPPAPKILVSNLGVSGLGFQPTRPPRDTLRYCRGLTKPPRFLNEFP